MSLFLLWLLKLIQLQQSLWFFYQIGLILLIDSIEVFWNISLPLVLVSSIKMGSSVSEHSLAPEAALRTCQQLSKYVLNEWCAQSFHSLRLVVCLPPNSTVFLFPFFKIANHLYLKIIKDFSNKGAVEWTQDREAGVLNFIILKTLFQYFALIYNSYIMLIYTLTHLQTLTVFFEIVYPEISG